MYSEEMSTFIGEIAGIITSFLWATSSTLFTLGGKKQSPQNVNRMRLIGALILLGISHIVLLGTILPRESLYVWLLLGLSGIIGLGLGDGLLLWAYVIIGPRISMLIMSLVPIVTTAAAWIFMGESLSLLKVAAIGVTIGGVGVVVSEKREKGDSSPFKLTWFGIALAIGAMLGQAVQLLFAKEAMLSMGSSNPPLTATYIRIFWGTAAVWMITVHSGRVGSSINALGDRKFLIFIGLATIFGPFIGIWASFIAIDMAPIGIASTLMSLAPLFMIPVSWKVFGEKISARAIVGTLIALVGVAGLFLLP